MTLIAAGMVKVTRRVVPTMVVTAVALVVTAAPPAAGSSLTSVSAGWMVPVGKLEPVTLTAVRPAWPEVGAAAG
ncbi:MAG: hypothetical protein SFV54_01475 [Bryobacteraceae bacterium]|nr:hypothetical protein [Bryobacteraceae bacterium]